MANWFLNEKKLSEIWVKIYMLFFKRMHIKCNLHNGSHFDQTNMLMQKITFEIIKFNSVYLPESSKHCARIYMCKNMVFDFFRFLDE